MKNKLFAEGFNICRKAKTDKYLKKQLKLIKEKADEFISEGIPSMSYSDFQIYYKTGSRNEYELKYFARRGRLNAFALLSIVYGQERYIKAYEDTVWAICDEFTWALPAHVENDLPIAKYRGEIDLFAAETGFALAESSYLLKSMLSEKVLNRIEYEIRDRIINSYLIRKEFKWSNSHSNWASVCAGSVGAAFLYLANEDEIKKALPKIENTLSRFLSGYGTDGVCVEGYGYWSYGFGFFVYFAELLRQYSDGEKDYFINEKVKKIASFQENILLTCENSVRFSDAPINFRHFSGLTHFLHRKYKNVSILPDKCAALFGSGDRCYRWAHFIREFAWRYDGEFNDKYSVKSGMLFFKDAEWYIHRGRNYGFAAKSGHNAEPHNHNDVGSFMLYVNDDCIFEDLGSGEYTANYFGKERYSYLVNSSRGHNLPIIGGMLQKAGKEYTGNVLKVTENEFEVDIAAAYGDKDVQKVIRKMCVEDAQITFSDQFVLNKPFEVVERLVTCIKPEKGDGFIEIGSALVEYDESDVSCEIHSDTYRTPTTDERTVYYIDFKSVERKTNTEIFFKILF